MITDGKFKKLIYELISYGNEIAKNLNSEVIALSIGDVAEDELKKLGPGNIPIYFPEHHLSHAASAFYPSPYENSAILTIVDFSNAHILFMK